MQISFRWTDGKDQDFQYFWLKTEEYYNQLVGGAGNRKAFMPYNISDNIPHVLIAYDGDAAIGCAGLKPYSGNSAEIKRVWVEPSYRRGHIAQEMMTQLEKKALENGFNRLILQTREIMTGAVRLYMKLGYHCIQNYPPYDNLDGAVCFAKEL
ncbi:MAG: GNAT family N-acetyltransferase [Oscillospiraceae bacterium]|nr:GNAT family N-acetyltransferase [Oscillospiraceae bacterium]